MTKRYYQLEDAPCLALLKEDDGIKHLLEEEINASTEVLLNRIDEIEDYIRANATCLDFQDITHPSDTAYDYRISLMTYGHIYWVDAPEADTEFCITEKEGYSLFASYCS